MYSKLLINIILIPFCCVGRCPCWFFCIKTFHLMYIWLLVQYYFSKILSKPKQCKILYSFIRKIRTWDHMQVSLQNILRPSKCCRLMLLIIHLGPVWDIYLPNGFFSILLDLVEMGYVGFKITCIRHKLVFFCAFQQTDSEFLSF